MSILAPTAQCGESRVTASNADPVARGWEGRAISYAVGEHAVTLTGVEVEDQTAPLVDVENGQVRTFSMAQFTSFWSTFGNMAVIVR